MPKNLFYFTNTESREVHGVTLSFDDNKTIRITGTSSGTNTSLPLMGATAVNFTEFNPNLPAGIYYLGKSDNIETEGVSVRYKTASGFADDPTAGIRWYFGTVIQLNERAQVYFHIQKQTTFDPTYVGTFTIERLSATMPQLIDVIRTSAYGEQVRDAIADALEKLLGLDKMTAIFAKLFGSDEGAYDAFIETGTLTPTQQERGRRVIDAAGLSQVVRTDTDQNLTLQEQENARVNIGAANITMEKIDGTRNSYRMIIKTQKST